MSDVQAASPSVSSPVSGTGLSVAPDHVSDETCCSSFFRSVRQIICCNRYLPESERSELIVEGRRSLRVENRNLEEEAARAEKLFNVVQQHVASLNQPSGDELQEIWNIAICRISTISSVDDINVGNIFGPGEVELKKQEELRRAAEFESKVKPYANLQEYVLKSDSDFENAKECSISFDEPFEMVCYQETYFCNYQKFLDYCRGKCWHNPWEPSEEVSLDLVKKVVYPTIDIPPEGFDNPAYEPDDVNVVSENDSEFTKL